MNAKAVIIAALCAVSALAVPAVGTADAGPAQHTSFSYSGENTYPAGTVCDFNYRDTFTVVFNSVAVPAGASSTQGTFYVTHTNLDTGYSLSEVDHVTIVSAVGSPTLVDSGIYFHLRDASGRTVLVKAGEATIDESTGQVLSFTPNSGMGQTEAQLICPALGGAPA
jgi:hypothetical protein